MFNTIRARSTSLIFNNADTTSLGIMREFSDFLYNHRTFGHLSANLDPLDLKQPQPHKDTFLQEYPILSKNIDEPIPYDLLKKQLGSKTTILHSTHTVRDAVSLVEKTYSKLPMALDISHLRSKEEKKWLYRQYEATGDPEASIPDSTKIRIAKRLIKGHLFNSQLATKLQHVKRFSHEGTESFIASLETVFLTAGKLGASNVVLGMPHRGRLNVLSELLRMPPHVIFSKGMGGYEIPLKYIKDGAIGDVLSHLHITSKYSPTPDVSPEFSHDLEWSNEDARFGDGGVTVSLLPNPSHLELVDPVAIGKAHSMQRMTHLPDAIPSPDLAHTLTRRAKKIILDDHSIEDSDIPPLTEGQKKVLCVLIHGDSSFAGQGVVGETLQLSNHPDFTVGGTVHIIVNNQLGFSAEGHKSRSTRYSADLSRFIDAPIFHVNAEHPEHVIFMSRLATAYRYQFGKDVILELHGYRRYGHNEHDPSIATQPKMYSRISQIEPLADSYPQKLASLGVWSSTDRSKFSKKVQKSLDSEFQRSSKEWAPEIGNELGGVWSEMTSFGPRIPETTSKTTMTDQQLKYYLEASTKYPKDFNVHPLVEKSFIKTRLSKFDSGFLDWAAAESAAFAHLLDNGYHIRLTGQDVGRATFFHRHMALVDSNLGSPHEIIPLNQIAKDNPNSGYLSISNSILSELAVMGFEYGYSIDDPNTLPILEMQFGDFFNPAQTIIDTYVTGGEIKWLRQSSLILQLPHGLDGAGPEHSSARIERWLQLSDESFGPNSSNNVNIQVVNLTTPANLFHVLVRQMTRSYRKPLINIAPKILLRHSSAVSPIKDFINSGKVGELGFNPIIPESNVEHEKITRVLLCSGKVYFDLVDTRNSLEPEEQEKFTIIRIEELSPFPFDLIQRELNKFSTDVDIHWVQEEHQNQGAYTFIVPRLASLGFPNITYTGRRPLAAPSEGITHLHKASRQEFLSKAFQF